MISTPSTLPDDPVELKKIIAEMAAVQQHYESENELLREQNRKLFDQLFGRKSEKLFSGSPQLLLFDMHEVDPEAEPEIEDNVEVPSHSRKKPGRKPLPENLPRVEVVHDISEEEKVCGCGAALERIGEEVSEKLDIIPAIIRVIRHIRPKYGCRCCEGVEDDGPTIKIAPVPPQIIPKGIASAGLLAHILT
ncbi:MAG: transposase, partial [Desulfobulbia bacterium]